MVWLVVGVCWVAVALPVAVAIGRAIRLGDERPTLAARRPALPLPRPRSPVEQQPRRESPRPRSHS